MATARVCFYFAFFLAERAAFDKDVYGEKGGHGHDLVYILGLLRKINKKYIASLLDSVSLK